MTKPLTADDIADEIANTLDNLMVREDADPDDVAWLGSYSDTYNEVSVSASTGQRFRVTVEEVKSK